ncbi:MAG: hypothetical protein A2Z15_06445 [Chloroflexi bacterium RBG_16_50_11]|nr:MAG: hypothetical protein A2Z15_06445 [Chloroflexi bacterium RBG_16_50_11]
MMKRIFIIIGLITVSLILVAAGISCSIDKITASLGQEFTLPVGQTAVIDSEDLTLKFVEVTADSRCAKGVVCVWAGEAKCRVQINYKGALADMDLTQPGGDVAQDYFIQFKFSFKLEPYPESGKQIAGSDYKLVMTVTK